MSLRGEVPDLAQGEDENDDVCCDIRYGVADEEMLGIYALRFGIHFVPETVNGIAREDGDEDDGNPPCNDHCLHNVGRELEFGDGEDSAVKGEDGEFDREDGGAVEEFIGKEAVFRRQIWVLLRAMLPLMNKRVYLEVLRYIFERDSGDVFPRSEMCHLH